MNFWQIVMLMLWFAFILTVIWAMISIFIDVANREDVSGVAMVGWIVVLLILPIIGILLYLWKRPKLTPEEKIDRDEYEAAVVPSGVEKAERVAELAQLRTQGESTDEEYESLKADVIG